MNRLAILTALAAGSLSLAACGDNRTDDVVQTPVEGAVPTDMPIAQAETAQSEAAMALGMTRDQLEDADLVSPNGTKLGDVDALVVDAQGQMTHLVVELEGPGDKKVQVPADKVRAHTPSTDNDRDLATDLTVAELAALPAWTFKGN
jgi:hypothetical protein